MVAPNPISIKGLSAGFCPIQPNKIKSETKNQKQVANMGLKLLLLISEVFIKGIIIKTKIALIIATTPPNLFGIQRKIA